MILSDVNKKILAYQWINKPNKFEGKYIYISKKSGNQQDADVQKTEPCHVLQWWIYVRSSNRNKVYGSRTS